MSRVRLGRPHRVLVIQLRRLGDVVLTTALLEDLRRAFPESTVDFLVGDRAAPLLDHHPLIHERIVYDRAHPTRTWRLVRRRAYDWIIDPQSSPRTAPLALVSGAPVRAGFATRVWGWFYTHRLARSGRPPEYVARERQRLLELLGVPIGPARSSLVLTDDERAAGQSLLASHGVARDRRAVGLVLSTGDPAREWPAGHFGTLAGVLARAGVQPVVFEMGDDAAKILEARERSSSLVQVQTHGLRAFMGALAAVDALVSGDTGPAHIATALGVPRVTVYGQQLPETWTPRDDPSVIALRAESARGLGMLLAGDPRAATLAAEVTAEAVFDAVRELLSRRATRR